MDKFLISKKLNILDELIYGEKIVLVFSKVSLSEFVEVANRPKFRKYFTIKDIEYLLKFIDEYGILVNVKSDMDICRDKKDNFLLNLAVDSDAEYLVTGDQDLLILNKIQNTQILTLKDFLEKI